MSNYIDSEGGTFDSVAVGGGIRSDGDVTTQHGSINNTRQVLTVTSGTTIKVTYPVYIQNMGGSGKSVTELDRIIFFYLLLHMVRVHMM